MIKKLLAFVIIFLFIGASVVSSSGHIIQNNNLYNRSLKSIDSSKEIISRGNIAYGYVVGGGFPEGPCYFDLNNPENITSLAPTESDDLLRGGTWTCDGRWFAIGYNSGILWEIDPETGDMWPISGGGSGLCGLSYNPVNEKMYKVCSSVIYEINITTWEECLICELSGEPIYLIGIAFDKNGILYGWDTGGLWIIDIETCEATFVAPFSINYIGDCCFDFDTNKFYCTAYINGGQLYEIDLDTGSCILVGSFEGGAEITDLSISFDCENNPPSKPKIDGQTCGKPGVEYEYTFVSTDLEGHDIRYFIDWYSSGDYIVTPYYPPEEKLTLPYTWPIKGTFTISAMAQDSYGAESENGTLTVTMPRYKIILHNTFFLQLFKSFPLIHHLFNILRWYN